MERAAERNVTVEQEGDGYTYREDADENRAMFLFDDKPDAAIRAVLKRHAFKWSPTRGAWVRMLNNARPLRRRAMSARREKKID